MGGALRYAITHLTYTEEFTALELWRALSSSPAECLGQKVSAIVPHQSADILRFTTRIGQFHQVSKLLGNAGKQPRTPIH
ncbi:MAG: hypothetical protein V7K89_28480 [Nostoc sp.]|uniref:hypothetical protein n=1 Tax=Nostoc sp. TaxID=1180 RepID=UPI002FF69219